MVPEVGLPLSEVLVAKDHGILAQKGDRHDTIPTSPLKT